MTTENNSNSDVISKLESKVLSLRVTLIILVMIFIGFVLLILPYTINILEPIKSILQNLGSVIIGSMTISLIYEIYLRREFHDQLARQTEKILSVVFPEFSRLSHKGFVNVYEDRDTVPWETVFNDKIEKILILATSISYWLDQPKILTRIKNAADRSSEIKILALDPKSEFTKLRSIELGYPNEEMFASDISNGINRTRRIFENKGNVQVGTYNLFPTIVLVITNERVIVGFLLKSKDKDLRARQYAHIDFKISSPFAKHFVDHFSVIWEKSSPIGNL